MRSVLNILTDGNDAICISRGSKPVLVITEGIYDSWKIKIERQYPPSAWDYDIVYVTPEEFAARQKQEFQL